MKPNEEDSTYLLHAQEYSDTLSNIGEPVKEKDNVMLVILGLREEYNGIRSTLMARQVKKKSWLRDVIKTGMTLLA